MDEKDPYEKIIELNSKKMRLQEEIEDLQPRAVINLYNMGYSMDRISIMLGMGKNTVMGILHEGDVEIKKQGRQKNNKSTQNKRRVKEKD